MEDFGEQSDVVERLRALGRQPVDPALASAHLTAMAGGRPGTQVWTRLKVGAAFMAGLLLGGTGLASAGALPDPVQDVAHSALKQVGISVPPGHERYNGPECGNDAAGQPFRNHGQYVRAHKGDPEAARSRCGKPLKAGQGGTSPASTTPGTTGGTTAAACQGPPPWAKDKSMTAEQKKAAQAARRAACPGEADEAEVTEDETEAPGQGQGAGQQNQPGQPTAGQPATGRSETGRPGAGGQSEGKGNADEAPGRAPAPTTTTPETTTTTASEGTTTTSTLGD